MEATFLTALLVVFPGGSDAIVDMYDSAKACGDDLPAAHIQYVIEPELDRLGFFVRCERTNVLTRSPRPKPRPW